MDGGEGVRVRGAVWGVIRFVGTKGGTMFQHMSCHLGFLRRCTVATVKTLEDVLPDVEPLGFFLRRC